MIDFLFISICYSAITISPLTTSRVCKFTIFFSHFTIIEIIFTKKTY